jgi:hypothetical protein|tara:strand:+ start:44271 stop:44843 length:573 start_codon:yes stop_codon:yes gene_type:complete
MTKETKLFDSDFPEHEQLPRTFTIDFETIEREGKTMTKIIYQGMQVGDYIDDNSRVLDNYRFHDVFHYTFATVLGWSPCARAMLKRKRKSVSDIDQFEDGARATITEEAVSLIVFNYAKKRNLLDSDNNVESEILDFIKDSTSPFEVSKCTKEEWEKAILMGYSLFRNLVKHDGGKIYFDMNNKTARFIK